MSPAELIAQLRRRGAVLYADDGVLRVSTPKGAIDSALAAEIRLRKPELLALLDAERDDGIAPVPRDSALPLGFVQQRMWVHAQLEPDTVLYNLPAAWRLRGALDVPALQRALQAVVARHEVLRTSVQTNTGDPRQSFGDAASAGALAVEDLSALAPDARELRLRVRLHELRDAPINLAAGVPYRARLFVLANDEHILFFMPHHVVWDGWSFDIFLRDLDALYAAHTGKPAAALPELPIQYADYAVWHRRWLDSGAMHVQVDHWLTELRDAPHALELPTDLVRPRVFGHRGDWEEFELTATTIERVTRLAASHRATSFIVLLAAWYAFLYRHSGQSDIVVGAPTQARQRPEVGDVIGCFVNTLCLRQRIDGQASFDAFVAAVRETCLRGYEHQDAPVDLLVDRLVTRRDPSRTPLFQAMFSHQQVSRRPRRLGDVELVQLHVNPAATPTDLMLAVMEGSSGARGVLHYSSELFTAATVRALRLQFQHMLDEALAYPSTTIDELPLTTPVERAALFDDWNATARPLEPGVSMVELFQRQAQATPQAPALQFGTQRASYRELDERSNRLAHELRARGIGRGALVGLCAERGIEMVVALLAVLKSGAAYVPLDPHYPPQRLAFMADDAKLALLVTQASVVHAIDWPRERSILLDIDAMHLDMRPTTPVPPHPSLDAGVEDPAYVIYTSGSTGRPKGVLVPHRALANFLVAMRKSPGLRSGERVLALTTLGFDIAVLELLLPLTVGAQVVIAGRDEALDAHALRRLIEFSGVDVMQATPATWRMLIDAGWHGSERFRALIGGEALPLPLAQQLLERCGELWNMYGPTETTVWSTCWRVERPEAGIAIGRPIANTQVWILDERRKPCPIGVPGEICIGGAGVALGYFDRPELTAERFIVDPFSADSTAWLYRTGDRGRWRHDGLLEHLGRFDFQVKLRGHRIELGEIESNLLTHPNVAQALAVVREDRPSDMRLVAYVVPRAAMPSANELREHLRALLPEYMLPQHCVELAELPRLPNGKVDRNALPPPSVAALDADAHRGFDAPSGSAEIAVAGIWSELLGIDKVGRGDNFFDLGGHSLLAIRAVAEIDRRLGLRVHVRRMMFETVAQIATGTPSGAAPTQLPAPRGWLHRLTGGLWS
jgi:amino acid adenylation domain-containing protein